MIFKKLTILSFLFQATVLQTTIIDNYAESKIRKDVDENLLQKRCELINYNYKLDNASLIRCIKNLTKPGHCPSRSHNSHEYYGKMICLETCQRHDYKCPGTQKCCHENDCGMICQEPDDLNYDNSLPPIPTNLIAKNLKRKGRTCELSWEIPFQHSPHNQTGHFLYIVECRWHYGTQFSPRKLREWEWLNYEITAHLLTYRTSVKRMQARIKLKRGRFYQFRVAMINENGFRGYSDPSSPFRLHDVATHITDPRPPKEPKNLKITPPKLLANNSIYAKVTWLPNKSDIPIEKYLISWALYIKAENNSLLLNEAFVKEPIHSYEFWNLQRNSVYYIQVQAVAVHGRRRPKSAKASIFYYTNLTTTSATVNSKSLESLDKEIFNQNDDSQSATNLGGYINSTGYNIIGKSKNSLYLDNNNNNNNYHNNYIKPPTITIKFLSNRKYGLLGSLLVRVIFNKDSNNEKYLLELCPGNYSNCESKEYEAAKTKKDQIDFSQLKFNKQYTLRLIDTTTNHIDSLKGDGIVLTRSFLTPTCTEWLKKHPNLKTNFKC